MNSKILHETYQSILETITRTAQSANRNPNEITLIAVSKGQPIEKIQELYSLGHRDFGENYAQELLEKNNQLHEAGCTEIRWHFIGHLQTNKVKKILPYLFCVHTMDSEKIAKELSTRWANLGKSQPFPVFLEVNIDNEPSKSGVTLQEVGEFAEKMRNLPELSLQGLMCIPSASADSKTRFRLLREMTSLLGPLSNGKCSMGMSDDFEIAIQEGATHVRVGTALFGKRGQH